LVSVRIMERRRELLPVIRLDCFARLSNLGVKGGTEVGVK